MVRIACGVLAAVIAGGGYPPPAGAADPGTGGGTPLKIGMPQGMFRDVQPAMVQAMSKPFRSLFERQTGLVAEVEIVQDGDAIAAKMKEHALHLGVFHGFEFARARTLHPDLRAVVVTAPQGGELRACVVVHRDSKVEKLADLENESLTLPRGLKAHCFAFVEKARRNFPATTAAPAGKATKTTEDVLNAVADGTLAAALVDAAALAAYESLQPGTCKHLKVVVKSEAFPVSVVAYRHGTLSDDAVNRIRAGLVGADKTPQGKPLLMLWSLKGFEDVPADYEGKLETCLKAYPAAAAK